MKRVELPLPDKYNLRIPHLDDDVEGTTGSARRNRAADNLRHIERWANDVHVPKVLFNEYVTGTSITIPLPLGYRNIRGYMTMKSSNVEFGYIGLRFNEDSSSTYSHRGVRGQVISPGVSFQQSSSVSAGRVGFFVGNAAAALATTEFTLLTYSYGPAGHGCLFQTWGVVPSVQDLVESGIVRWSGTDPITSITFLPAPGTAAGTMVDPSHIALVAEY